MTIQELGGEFAFIDRIRSGVGTHPNLLTGIGDDAAVLRGGSRPGVSTVVTTDLLIEDAHFRRSWCDAYSLGVKSLVVSLSDIAAMGARPTFAFLSLALPPAIAVEWLDDFYRAVNKTGAFFGATVAGGDTNVSTNKLVINVTLMGEVEEGKAFLRSGARAGDKICVTGALGNAAAGLALLEKWGRENAEAKNSQAVRAQLAPIPRIAEAAVLSRTGGVTAAMDVSDGLLGDLAKLCRASGVGAVVQNNAAPIGEPAHKVAAQLGEDAEAWAFYGGEDYELLFTAPAEIAPELCQAIVCETRTPATIIGEIVAGKGVSVERDGQQIPARAGWDHFARG